MAILGRFFLVLIIGAFPMGIYFFSKTGQAPEPPIVSKPGTSTIPAVVSAAKLPSISSVDSMELINKGIESKVHELKQINVQILENRGKILRLEDERQNKLRTLQELQVKLSAVIEDANSQKNTTTK